MKNRNISHAHQEVEIYKAYYRPSLNIVRLAKSFLGVLILGQSTVSRNYTQKRREL
jgi:hypothetical protein